MSKQSARYRRVTRRHTIREQLDAQEYAREMRAGIQQYADYLTETGGAYQ